MRILWLVNNPLPQASERLGLPVHNTGGWLSAQLERLDTEKNSISVCCLCGELKEAARIEAGGVSFIVLPRYEDSALKGVFSRLLREEDPDIVHIHGTEFYHSYAMLLAAEGRRTIVSIQGLVSVYAKHYFADLPASFQKPSLPKRLLSRLLGVRLVKDGRADYERRGQTERGALLDASNIIGRTEWDRACTERINPKARYFSCGEILRAPFYEEPKWSYEACEKHSVFISQGYYPIKGFHKFLLILPELAAKYPDLKVYVTGREPRRSATPLRERLNSYLSEYPGCLKALMKGHEDRVVYLGELDACQVRQRLLSANVFVLCSSIENSPNSLGEAMLTGTPIVASNVGGVCDMLRDREDGYLYPFNEEYMLLHYIDRVFQAKDGLRLISQNSVRHAMKNHDPERITARLMEIYNTVLGEES
ncbi:MAG: glycosyltransferase family 4 protein [Oscillospiraceae bacterium]|nr:glycosyltransferase family 4 protein [Oscillospiraceae bacterium]